MSLEIIKAALEKHGEMSSGELQDITSFSRSCVNDKLRRLIAAKEVHVSGSRPQVGVQGCATPLYALGAKKAKRVKVTVRAAAVRPSVGMWAGLMA